MSHRSARFSSTASLVALAVFTIVARPGQAQPDAAQIVPGDLALALPSPLPSSLDLDGQALETELCGKPDPDGGAGEVGLSVANDGSSGPFIISVLGVAYGELEDTARVSAGRLHWIGLEPFPTACGSWSYAVTLDPDALQPESDLVLGRAAGPEPTAPFAGTVEAPALLRFTAADGLTREIPVLVHLDLAGRWTVAGNPGADGGSNLVLFVEQAMAALLNPS